MRPIIVVLGLAIGVVVTLSVISLVRGADVADHCCGTDNIICSGCIQIDGGSIYVGTNMALLCEDENGKTCDEDDVGTNCVSGTFVLYSDGSCQTMTQQTVSFSRALKQCNPGTYGPCAP